MQAKIVRKLAGPDLVTLHLWAWYPNPAGIFNGTNRWVRPFNDNSV